MPDLSGIISPEIARQLALLDKAAARRTRALVDAEEAGAEARALVVTLLRAGYPRKNLVNRPFSSAWLTRIQEEEGLIRRRTSTPQE